MRETPAILAGFTLSEAQAAAAMARGQDVAVTAGAGTGKTRTLVARYLALLADGLPLRQIVAITFTRKAAREMRNRVRQEIGTYLRQVNLAAEEKEQWQSYYNELDAARIGTIHNLCGEILRAHPAEVGIDPQFSVLDEMQSALLVQEAAEATLAWAVETEDMAAIFSLLTEQELLELITVLLNKRLAAEQVMAQQAVENVVAHWREKLEAVQSATIEQLQNGQPFKEVIAILERNQAHNREDKAEVQRRMALGAIQALDGESPAGKIRDLRALDSINLSGGSQKSWPGGKEQLQEVKEALKELRALYRERPLLALSINEQDEVWGEAMPAVYLLFEQAGRIYQGLKADREGLDFDDLEALAIQLLVDHPAVRGYWQGQIGALLVDEFQDTNEQQSHFMRLLCPEAGKLFIVGDAKQSIYRFRGADVAVFAQEKERIRQQKGSLIDLDKSYRAHEALLTGMNHMLRPILGDPTPGLPPWVAPFTPLRAGTKGIDGDLSPPFVEFHLTVGNKPEALPRAAEALAERLGKLHREQGVDYGDMAVLCRASSSFQYYEDAFDAASIPYLTVAGKGFYERPEVRDLLNALQAIADPHDDVALTGLLRSPACGISDVSLYRIMRGRPAIRSLWDHVRETAALEDLEEEARLRTAIKLIADLNQQAGRIPVADLLKRFLDQSYYRAILRKVKQPRALRNVAKLLNDIHQSELVHVNEFLEYVQTIRDSGTRAGEARATSSGAVQIMSIHAAKGLEFPVVILGDASSGSSRFDSIVVDPELGILLDLKNEEGVRPAGYALWTTLAKEQDSAELARLLYVALTRAEQMLLISGYVRQGKAGSLNWSGWLAELADISGLSGEDLSAYHEGGDEQHLVPCAVEETEIAGIFYEPYYAADHGPGETPAVDHEDYFKHEAALREPIAVAGAAEASRRETAERVWQVVPTTKRPTAPAWVIGSLVHEALALWRFPGPGFEAWVSARARRYGIADQRQLRHAQGEMARLLKRFQASALFREMETAERRIHEVPFAYRVDGETVTGIVDALYKHGGQWTVVDFKSDGVRDEASLRKLLADTDYVRQLLHYGEAVEKLLGERARPILCFLNYAGGVRLVTDFGGE